MHDLGRSFMKDRISNQIAYVAATVVEAGTPSAANATTTQITTTNSSATVLPTAPGPSDDKKWHTLLEIALPSSLFLLLLLLILLVYLLKKRHRKRERERELLPDYAYDHSEADIFDSYGQFSGSTSAEGLLDVASGFDNKNVPVSMEHGSEDKRTMAGEELDNPISSPKVGSVAV